MRLIWCRWRDGSTTDDPALALVDADNDAGYVPLLLYQTLRMPNLIKVLLDGIGDDPIWAAFLVPSEPRNSVRPVKPMSMSMSRFMWRSSWRWQVRAPSVSTAQNSHWWPKIFRPQYRSLTLPTSWLDATVRFSCVGILPSVQTAQADKT